MSQNEIGQAARCKSGASQEKLTFTALLTFASGAPKAVRWVADMFVSSRGTTVARWAIFEHAVHPYAPTWRSFLRLSHLASR